MDEDTKTPSGEAQHLPSIPTNDDLDQNNSLFNSNRLDMVMRWASLYAASKVVPVHCQGSPETCAILIGTALRLQLDPFMFMQNCYVVGGRPGMNGQLMIAMINSSGRFTPLNWRFEGTERTDNHKVICSATRKSTGEICTTTVSWKTVKAEGWDRNPKWLSITEQMFCYRSAAFFARRHCPEVLVGFAFSDELEDMNAVETTAQPIPPPPVDPDDPPHTKTSTAAPAQTAEGPTSTSAPYSETETPSASQEIPEAWQTKPASNDTAVLSSAEFSLFWPRYRQKFGENKKPAQDWLAAHHYSSTKEVRKSDFQQMLKDLT